jgi:cell wall-associated NlpC family hydrolase
MDAWVAKYVGIPFLEHGRSADGCDCWGLARLVLEERYGVRVKDFSDCYATIEDGQTIEALCRIEAESWECVDQPQPGDVVLLRVAGLATHVGIVVAPGVMLHVMRGMDAVVERYDGPIWRPRIDGFFRYVD